VWTGILQGAILRKTWMDDDEHGYAGEYRCLGYQFSDCEVFDPSTQEWSAMESMRGVMDWHCNVAVAGSLSAIGGREQTDQLYDETEKRWFWLPESVSKAPGSKLVRTQVVMLPAAVVDATVPSIAADFTGTVVEFREESDDSEDDSDDGEPHEGQSDESTSDNDSDSDDDSDDD
jgi:hypothetical protein